MREAVESLVATLQKEVAHTIGHLIDISGPTGMRNSLGSSIGLAENSIREEIIRRLEAILADD
jgi:hypothetical protein